MFIRCGEMPVFAQHVIGFSLLKSLVSTRKSSHALFNFPIYYRHRWCTSFSFFIGKSLNGERSWKLKFVKFTIRNEHSQFMRYDFSIQIAYALRHAVCHVKECSSCPTTVCVLQATICLCVCVGLLFCVFLVQMENVSEWNAKPYYLGVASRRYARHNICDYILRSTKARV